VKKDYFSPQKTGGSFLSAGIAYQDLVSLLFLFKHISKKGFKAITFETHDDFTILMDTHEILVQVKNTLLTVPKLKDILFMKSSSSEKRAVSHVIVASDYDYKLNGLLNYSKHHKNALSQMDIEDEFNQLLFNNGIDTEMFKNTAFEKCSDSNIEDAVKFYIYQWADSNHWSIDIEDLFNKLVATISLYLRPERSSLSRDQIEEMTLSCPRKEFIKNEESATNIRYDFTKNSIILALTKDIAQLKQFSDKLNLIKLNIEIDRWEDASRLASEIYKYEETFTYYYFWTLYQSGKNKLLMKKCNESLKENHYLFYANYFKGLVFTAEKAYPKAINSFKKALLNSSTFDVNLRLGRLYCITGNTKESLKHYQFCLSSQPLNEEVLVEISPLLPHHEAIECLDQAIELNPQMAQAYFEKGKILRYYGLYKDAFDYFQIYLTNHADSQVLSDSISKEISLCLLSMQDVRAFDYMNNWLTNFLFDGTKKEIEDGECIAILNNSWTNIQIIVCTKTGDDFIVHTSIREYVITKGEGSYIFIGCAPDSFLKMTGDMFREHHMNVERGYELLPAVMKLYRSKNEFDKVVRSMQLKDHTNLNKDFNFTDPDSGIRWHFKEYISKKSATRVRIEEMPTMIYVQAEVGNSAITGWFKKGGKGYFSFCSKVESPPPFNEAVLILECNESKEKVHVKFQVQNIKIVKRPVYPRASYVKDIVLPFE